MRAIKKQFPPDFDPDDCLWISIPCALVPIIAGKVAELERRAEWQTTGDWEEAYKAIVRWEAELLSCEKRITDRLDRVLAALGYAAGRELTDPAYDPSDTQLAALARLDTGDATLDDIIDHVDQLETYLRGIADILGGHTLPPVDP